MRKNKTKKKRRYVCNKTDIVKVNCGNQCECTSIVFIILCSEIFSSTSDMLYLYCRKEQYPSFPILRQLCAWASIDGNIDDVKRIKDMARSGYPRQYKYHLYFDTYFAR